MFQKKPTASSIQKAIMKKANRKVKMRKLSASCRSAVKKIDKAILYAVDNSHHNVAVDFKALGMDFAQAQSIVGYYQHVRGIGCVPEGTVTMDCVVYRFVLMFPSKKENDDV